MKMGLLMIFFIDASYAQIFGILDIDEDGLIDDDDVSAVDDSAWNDVVELLTVFDNMVEALEERWDDVNSADLNYPDSSVHPRTVEDQDDFDFYFDDEDTDSKHDEL